MESTLVPTLDQTNLDEGQRRELLQRQIEIQRRLIELVRADGLAAYRPHYKQHLFHSATAKRRGFFAGNRTGKSEGNAAETAAWARGERIWYKVPFDILGVDHEDGRNRRVVPRSRHPGGDDHLLVRQGIPPYATKQLVVCANWNKVDEIWTSQSSERPGKIWKFLPKGFAKGYTNHAGVISQIICTNGSIIDFMSVDAFKRDPLVAESSDYDRVVIDEPCPQSLWKGLSRGLVDRHGQADFAMTSLSEIWIPDKFEQDPDGVYGPDEIRPFRDRFSVRAHIADNPHLTDSAIEEFANDLTDDEKACRLAGIPLERSGLIYKEFSHERHVLKDLPEGWSAWNLPSKTCCLHVRIDTHPVKPHAVLFAAVGPSCIPVVCHELYVACDADTLCQHIKSYVLLTGCPLASIKVEPAAWNPDPATKRASIASYFFRHGLFIQKAPKDLINGIIITKAKLKNLEVFFVPTLRRVFWEFSRYRYDPETGNPIDEEDHMMENLYRLLIQPLSYFDPSGQEGIPITDEPFTPPSLDSLE